MSIMSPLNNPEEAVKDLSISINQVENTFKSIDVDEYEAEMFYKGLSDAKSFVATLNWLIKRHSV